MSACLLQPTNAQFAVRSPCVYKYIDSRRARARSIVVLRECGERTRTGVLEAAIVPARRLCPRMLIRSSSTRRFSRTAWNWWKRGNTTHAYFLLESSARTPPVLRVARRYSPAPAGCIRRFLTTQLKQPVFSSNFHSTLTVDIVNQIIHIKLNKYLFNSRYINNFMHCFGFIFAQYFIFCSGLFHMAAMLLEHMTAMPSAVHAGGTRFLLSRVAKLCQSIILWNQVSII